MAQTGEVKWVVTAGVPTLDSTGEVKWAITAGIPNAYSSEPPPEGNPWYHYARSNRGQ